MKSLIAFLQVVANELATRCGTSASRDLKTISVRSEHEGLSFLAITLPNFCSDFQKSLEQGYVDHASFAGFKRRGGLPLFLGGFLDQVFDRVSGKMLDDPAIESIRAVRQITLLYSKIEHPCSEQRKKAALDSYVEIEKEIRLYDREFQGDVNNRRSDFTRIGRLLWADILSGVDNSIYQGCIVPKHSSGKTADRISGNRKYDSAVWTWRMEKVFPFWEFLIPSQSFMDRVDTSTFLTPGTEIPAKVVLVPKTPKTPRVIAMEPVAVQFVQQGILERITKETRRDDKGRAFVLNDSQEHNRVLAREGSVKGTLATLDLREASDRVSNQHVRALVENHRELRSAVDATRSRKADVPGHGVIRLAKYASMGSALCFPFEAMVFTTVIFMGIEKQLGRQLKKSDFKDFFGRVRVYGDDIIVPVDFVQSVIEELESFGFKVNLNKSFWKGKFRESCGAEYFDGHDISIVRCRRYFPRSRKDIPELESIVALRNLLFKAGYEESVDFLDNRIKKLIPFPIVEETSSLLGRLSTQPCQAEKICPDYQIPLVKGAVISHKLPESKLDDYGALLKWFLKRGVSPFEQKDHLEYSGRPVSARIKTRWASPR